MGEAALEGDMQGIRELGSSMCKGKILEVSLLGAYLVLLSGKRSPE